MKTFRDLEIFREAKILAIDVHRESMKFPKFELFEEGSQVRRSSKAVPALIAEGYGRKRYKRDFIKYLVWALAECNETVVHLDILAETGSINPEVYSKFVADYELLSKRLNAFIEWVIKNFQVKHLTDE